MANSGCISLRGVRVHNLQGVDLDLPRNRLIVLCGLSGSGKTSLALDTLYAEGQRRYIESFSAYTRQFLQRLEKPDADSIQGIPPAIAVTGNNASRSSRSTVGTATEINDYLRLLLAKIGRVYCRQCGRQVRCDTPQSVAAALAALPPGKRFIVAFTQPRPPSAKLAKVLASLREDGFVRVVLDGTVLDTAAQESAATNQPVAATGMEHSADGVAGCADDTANADAPVGGTVACQPSDRLYVIVDRLTAGSTTEERLHDSLETAFEKGQGRCCVLVEAQSPPQGSTIAIDGRPWEVLWFSQQLRCEPCGLDYPRPEPRLYSFNSPLGACPTCEGFGNIIDIDMELVVPDPNKSLREGAIAPWNTPAYSHELDELLELADEYGIPTNVPFRQLRPEHLELIIRGVPERNFGGLQGFFAWLERRKYKMHIRVLLSRYRSYRPCPDCGGARLRAEALATRLGGSEGGLNMAELCALKVTDLLDFLGKLQLCQWEQTVARTILDQLKARLQFLDMVGLGYLTLDRMLRTLSGGELRRVALTAALGSSLVNMLYVLDEPSIGLHPRDIARLLDAIRLLRDRGNTVVVVEHEESIIRAADHVVEIGPGAGERGGRIVFQGTPEEMRRSADSLTGQYLAGRRGAGPAPRRRPPNHGWIRLAGARGHNLKNITVEFPLGLLCVVTGVSGSGKSSLVQDTLYPALCRRLRKDAPKPLPYDDVLGDGQIDDVIMVDQSPIGRTPRSNPVTYIKAFDEIRQVFADTIEARTRNYTPGHFSFNVDGGRCSVCQGDGYLQIDMQFLADVYMRCPQCNGARYRDDILEITYRGRNIAEVLEMTVREAFTFFRGQPKVQARLKRLMDVGLDYLRLGQPANTLSGGEAQRLKLAGYMSAAKRGRCLFILDEPTTGLHFADVAQLLDCFDALLGVGHSLIVVEHNLQVIKAADYIIDLGPGAADQGGQVVAKGTPEMVARANQHSVTARFLAEALKKR